MKVLIVDDARVIRNIHRNTLLEHGFSDSDLIEAEDGAEAYKMACDEEIGLFLIDWNMPDLNGLELVKKIRAMAQYSGTPIIMITSEAARYNVVEAIDAGVSNYVIKPVKEKVLWEKISKYIESGE